MAKRGRDSSFVAEPPGTIITWIYSQQARSRPSDLEAAWATSPDEADVPSMPRSRLPLGFARRTPARSRPARSATHATSSPVGASVVIGEYSAPPAPVVRPFPSDRWRLTPCYDLSVFDSDNSRLVLSESPVSDVMSVVSLDMLSAPSLYLPGLWTGCGVAGVRRCCRAF